MKATGLINPNPCTQHRNFIEFRCCSNGVTLGTPGKLANPLGCGWRAPSSMATYDFLTNSEVRLNL
jgi:hypothetical protein